MPLSPKFKKHLTITADKTSTFDGSTVVDADLSETVLNAVTDDPEWAGAVGLSVDVKDCA